MIIVRIKMGDINTYFWLWYEGNNSSYGSIRYLGHYYGLNIPLSYGLTDFL